MECDVAGTAGGVTRRSASPSAKRVLVLQGGGALGSYQAGVYESLARNGLQPTWVAGISIGAINAALIAGNPPERAVERMRAFWMRATSGLTPAPPLPGEEVRGIFSEVSAGLTAMLGAPGFFQPRFPPVWLLPPYRTDQASYYDTGPLRQTLEELVDFDRINGGQTRLTVGAVNVLTGNSVIFDSAERRIGPEHIMASGALPPGLPAVMIDGEPYWDGGVVSNTPLQFVLDANDAGEGDDLVIFQVDLFNARGPAPKTLQEVDEREKDIRYSSRTRLNTEMSLRQHEAKLAVRSLLADLPPGFADREDVALLRRASHENAVTVVQLIYRKRPYEGGCKDFEFSRQTMFDHWAAGASDVDRFASRLDELLPRDRLGGVQTIDPGLSADRDPVGVES